MVPERSKGLLHKKRSMYYQNVTNNDPLIFLVILIVLIPGKGISTYLQQ